MIKIGLLMSTPAWGTPFIIICCLAFVLLSYLVYNFTMQKNSVLSLNETKDKQVIISCKKFSLNKIILIIFVSAFILRIIFSAMFSGHQDITYFRFWVDELKRLSPYNFYDNMPQNSYLPGYLYILYFLGGISELFNFSIYSEWFIVLLKLPSIICDCFCAYLILRIAKKYVNIKFAFAFSLLYLFNPATFINSSFWGQVDSFSALFTVLALYFLLEKNFLYGFIAIAFGMAFKLQFAFILPVICLFVAVCVYDILKNKDYKKLIKIFYYFLAMALTFIILILPFTLKYILQGDVFFILKVYFGQVDSFNYFSLNTFNFYSMILKNWVQIPTEKIFGFLSYDMLNYFIIAFISLYCMALLLKSKTKNNIFLIAALLVLGIFTFSMKMHERYMFTALAPLLIAVVISKDKRIITAFVVFSLLQFLNCGVLLFKVAEERYFVTEDKFLIICSNLWVFYFLYFAAMVTSIVLKPVKLQNDKGIILEKGFKADNEIIDKQELTEEETIKKKNEQFEERYQKNKLSLIDSALKKKDYIIMSVFLILYFLLNMINLGGTIAPQTYWESVNNDDYIILEILDGITIGEIWGYKGIDIIENTNNTIKIYASDTVDSENYDSIISSIYYQGKKNVSNNGDKGSASMYKWFNALSLDKEYKYVAFTVSKNVRINEIVLLEKDSRKIIDYTILHYKGEGLNTAISAFDEKETFLGYNSLMTDMYFDEIYHARTAFEHINGWKPYEVTHPPLGKIIISAGIKVFGMNPFGWRISGVIFSALLLPVMYALGKQFFKKTKWAVLFTLLFALDGLHFVQGRIATIDTYPVFFSCLSMHFMVKFFKTNILRENVFKCLLPFALSGIFFGFAIASKWTGVYTGGGLLVILIIYIAKMLDEYRYKVALYNDTEQILKQKSKDFDKKLIYIVLTGMIFFVIIPFSIYILSYLPYMTENKSLANLFKIMYENQIYMFSYHSDWVVGQTHPSQSVWFSWFFNYRSVYMYYADATFGKYARIHSMGNHAISWFGIIAMFYCFYILLNKPIIKILNKATMADRKAYIEKLISKNLPLPSAEEMDKKFKIRAYKKAEYENKQTLILIITGFLAAMLPWVLVERSTYIYHFYPAMPFYIGMIIYMLIDICKKHNKVIYNLKNRFFSLAITKGGLLSGIYISVAVLFFILLFPVFSGLPVSYNTASVMFYWFKFFGNSVGF